MAVKSNIVTDMMAEFGKQDPAARNAVDLACDEVVKSLLAQNDGRFRGLEASKDIDINTTDLEYKLPNDYNTAQETFSEIDTSGLFVGECSVTSKKSVHRRYVEDDPYNYRICYIEKHSNGWYLHLSQLPSSNVIFEFDYYRIATINDVSIIRDEEIIKNGIRGKLPQYCSRADYFLEIYRREKSGFRESPDQHVTGVITKVSRKTARYNKRMYGIGKGG